MNSYLQLDDIFFEHEPLPVNVTRLSEDVRYRARTLSQIGFGEAQRWQIYRNGLVMFGVRQWLSERGVQVSVDESQVTISDPVAANLVDAVVPIVVGEFRLALCIQQPNHLNALSIPQVLGHHSPFFAHLYVWVELSEEDDWISIHAGLWHQQFMSLCESSAIACESYQELTCSDMLTEDDILLALRCAQRYSEKIEFLPSTQSVTSQITPVTLDQKLKTWTELTVASEVLNPCDVIEILNSPQLSAQFSQTLEQKFRPSVLSQAIQSGINVGRWFSQTINETIDDMSWIDVPSFASAMRSDYHTTLFHLLTQQGVNIPPSAQVKYHDLSLGEQALRLFAMVWPQEKQVEQVDWTLLLVLSSQPNHALTHAVQLDVSDIQAHLASEKVVPGPKDCGFIQVAGDWTEKFWVTLSVLNCPKMTMTLPPFFFERINAPI